MKRNLKGLYLAVSSLVITLLHLPFAFANNARAAHGAASRSSIASVAPGPGDDSLALVKPVKSVYDSLQLQLCGLSHQAFLYAEKGWKKLVRQGRLLNKSVIVIIDFTQPSDQRRLFVLDMKNYRVLFNTLVAHGKNSGKEMASWFSNKPGSHKSSPGFYITGETYMGSNGYSLKLTGIERGINDKAYRRGIVMHGAEYVSDSYIDAQGWIGRSEGCPAVPSEEAGDIIDVIKEGSCLFIYPPGKYYASRSLLLK